MNGREIFLPDQQDVLGLIYHYTYSNDIIGICGKCDIQEKSHNGYIYARITNVMYGLPQAVMIAHDALVKYLDLYIYHP